MKQKLGVANFFVNGVTESEDAFLLLEYNFVLRAAVEFLMSSIDFLEMRFSFHVGIAELGGRPEFNIYQKR